MWNYGYDLGADSSAHAAAVEYIRGCLRPLNEKEIYWTISYARYEEVSGLRDLRVDTLNKIIGIMHHMAFNKGMGQHGRDRFIPAICSGKYGSRSQRKAAVDSVYHFLYLTKDASRMDAGVLHDMLRGLPCNSRNFVNCSLPVRRQQVEALLKFLIRSVEAPYRNEFSGFPRGVSVARHGSKREGAIIINSEELIEILWRRPEDADRIIEMFIEDETAVGMLEERLNTHTALDSGVL